MHTCRRPSCISVEEWETAKKRLPQFRGRYARCVSRMTSEQKATTGKGLKAQANSDQFLMYLLVLKMRQPRIRDGLGVKEDAQLFRVMSRLGDKIGATEE